MERGLGVVALVASLAAVVYFRRKRTTSWKAAETTGDGRSALQLVAGPWPGRVVNIDGVPRVGSAVSSWTWGLTGHDVHKGRYFITDVDERARRSVASWKLND